MTPSFRRAVTDLNVRRGLQGVIDLDSIERHGTVDSPAVSLSRELALEFAKTIDVDAAKAAEPRRRRRLPESA
jgi:hypothetical protein